VLSQGPQGPAGAAGAQGVKGDTGAAGTNGAPGAKGDTGAAGINGTDGTDGIGISSISTISDPLTCVAGGFEMDFSALFDPVTWCNGATGAKGDPGVQGDSIHQGNPSVQGDLGPQGNPGPAGIVPIYDNGGNLQSSQHVVTSTLTMPNTNGPSTITLSGSAVFSSASSYTCFKQDFTSNNGGVKLVRTSGTAFTGSRRTTRSATSASGN
jgi:hypothetical protein